MNLLNKKIPFLPGNFDIKKLLDAGGLIAAVVGAISFFTILTLQ